MESYNAAWKSHHLQASVVPMLLEIKKSLLELCMMDQVRMLSGGIVGVEYVGAGRSGPVYMTRRVKIDSPER
jgi:hypothetical protein